MVLEAKIQMEFKKIGIQSCKNYQFVKNFLNETLMSPR